ncbi:MAG: glycosyltransferase family 39 protein [Rhodospirillales bacterium]|nr:glycosyltransferase family 39 protein [Rhodospirillales bacterium]
MKAPSQFTGVADFFVRHRIPLLGIAAGFLLLDLIWVTGTYLVYPGYLDHGEPSVALISWRLLGGWPAFLDFDAPALISNVYGPMTYVVHAVSFWLLGPSIIAGKAASFVVAMLIPVFVFLSQRHRGNSQAAFGAILACGLVLFHVPFSIWNRPDSFMALLVVIAVWATNASDPGRPEWSKSILIAVTASLAVGMKLHAGAYFAPVVLFHCINENRGFKTFAAMAVIGMAVVFLPFGFSVFSLSAFVDWIVLHTQKESSSVFDSKFLRYGVLYSTPVLFYLASWRWSEKKLPVAEHIYFWVFVLSLIAILFPATKVGAGTHYFFPFLAVLIDQILRHANLTETRKAGVWGLAVILTVSILIVGIPVQKRFFRALHWQEVTEIQSEIRAIMNDNKGRSIEMGFGQNVAIYPRTLSRTLLVLAGNPYSIDSAPAMETNKWKIPLPEKTLSMLRNCKTDLWLIPTGERPFMMIGYYGEAALAPEFSKAFNDGYAKVKSYKYFDIWACKK